MSTIWETRPELPDGAPPPPPRQTTWPAWMGPVAVLTALIVASFGGLVVFGVGAIFGGTVADPAAGANLAATFVQDAVFVGTAIAFAWTVSRPYAVDFGFRIPRLPSAIGWSVAVYVSIMIVGAIATAAFGVEDQKQENILDNLGVRDGSVWVYVWAGVVCIVAPLAEETLFRGFVFRSMLPRLGLVGAAVASGAIFGLIHITNYLDQDASLAAASVVTLVWLGTAFAWLYWKTGSLLPGIALHAINNSLAFGTMQNWTWQVAILMPLSLATCALIAWLVISRWRPRTPAPAPA